MLELINYLNRWKFVCLRLRWSICNDFSSFAYRNQWKWGNIFVLEIYRKSVHGIVHLELKSIMTPLTSISMELRCPRNWLFMRQMAMIGKNTVRICVFWPNSILITKLCIMMWNHSYFTFYVAVINSGIIWLATFQRYRNAIEKLEFVVFFSGTSNFVGEKQSTTI